MLTTVGDKLNVNQHSFSTIHGRNYILFSIIGKLRTHFPAVLRPRIIGSDSYGLISKTQVSKVLYCRMSLNHDVQSTVLDSNNDQLNLDLSLIFKIAS